MIEGEVKDFLPLKDKVVLEIEPAPTTTASGLIHLPQGARQLAISVGTVCAVGKGEWLEIACRYEPPHVAVGDRVLFTSSAGTWLDEKKTKLLIRECDIQCIVGKTDTVTAWNRFNVHARDIE